MTVRFNCWVEAESLYDAWDKLDEICAGIYYRERSFCNEFTATVLENPEEDKKSIEELAYDRA